jgi:hypothetical protein
VLWMIGVGHENEHSASKTNGFYSDLAQGVAHKQQFSGLTPLNPRFQARSTKFPRQNIASDGCRFHRTCMECDRPLPGDSHTSQRIDRVPIARRRGTDPGLRGWQSLKVLGLTAEAMAVASGKCAIMINGLRSQELAYAMELDVSPKHGHYGFLHGSVEILRRAQRAPWVELDLGDQGTISIAVLQVSPSGLALISIRAE